MLSLSRPQASPRTWSAFQRSNIKGNATLSDRSGLRRIRHLPSSQFGRMNEDVGWSPCRSDQPNELSAMQEPIFARMIHECPRCRSLEEHRIAREGILENTLFLILWFWPCICNTCGLRYWDHSRRAKISASDGTNSKIKQNNIGAKRKGCNEDGWTVVSERSRIRSSAIIEESLLIELCHELRRLRAENSRLRLVVEDLVQGRYRSDQSQQATFD